MGRRQRPLDPPGSMCSFGPSENGRVSTSATLSFLAIPFLAFVLAGIAAQMDWDFLILKLGVLAVWVATFCANLPEFVRQSPLRRMENASRLCDSAPWLLPRSIDSSSAAAMSLMIKGSASGTRSIAMLCITLPSGWSTVRCTAAPRPRHHRSTGSFGRIPA